MYTDKQMQKVLTALSDIVSKDPEREGDSRVHGARRNSSTPRMGIVWCVW